MAAKRAINPNQLSMFMTPRELMEHFNPNPGDIDSHDIEQFDEDDNWRSDADVNKDFWDIKRDENAESGLTDDIRAIGVRVPVTVQHSKLSGLSFVVATTALQQPWKLTLTCLSPLTTLRTMKRLEKPLQGRMNSK